MKVRLIEKKTRFRRSRQYRAVLSFDNGRVFASTEFYVNRHDRDTAVETAIAQIRAGEVEFEYEIGT